jgi:hypothetical protein
MVTKRSKRYYAPQNDDNIVHICDHPGCQEKGEYRAPKDKSLKEYYWFCLKHVEEYNQQWNYYADGQVDEDEPRNKKRFYHRLKSKVRYQFGYDLWEEAAFFDDGYNNPSDGNREYSKDGIYFTVEERKHIKTLEMDIRDINPDSLKTQYKRMAKKYHPDINKEDAAAEEKFKQISEAYQRLKEKFERIPNYDLFKD